MYRRIVALLMLTLCWASSAEAQTRGRIIGTIGGAAAGTGLGLLLGIRAFDDAAYSDRKVRTATAVGGALGAVVGFAIGLEWDRRSRPTSPPDALDRGRDAVLEGERIAALARAVRIRLPGLGFSPLGHKSDALWGPARTR